MPVCSAPLFGGQQCLVLGIPCPGIESDMPMNSATLFCQNDLWSQSARQYEVCRKLSCWQLPAHKAHYHTRICQHDLPLSLCKPIKIVILSVCDSPSASVYNLTLWILSKFCRAEKKIIMQVCCPSAKASRADIQIWIFFLHYIPDKLPFLAWPQPKALSVWERKGGIRSSPLQLIWRKWSGLHVAGSNLQLPQQKKKNTKQNT